MTPHQETNMTARILIGTASSSLFLLLASLAGTTGAWAAVVGLGFLVTSAFLAAILTEDPETTVGGALRQELVGAQTRR